MGGKVSTFAIHRSGLNRVLAKIYPTVEKTEQFMKSVDLDPNNLNNRLSFDNGPSEYWHDILVRADYLKKVEVIIDKASQDHEDCADELAKAYQVYKESREMTTQGDYVEGDKIGSKGIAIGAGSSSSGSEVGGSSVNVFGGDTIIGNKISLGEIGSAPVGAYAIGIDIFGTGIGKQTQIHINSSLDEEE